jgi:L,D-transpeptidase YcbB
MRARWFDGVAAGALLALSLTLALGTIPAAAQSGDQPAAAPADQIEAGVPVPEPADVPPPSAADLEPSARSVSVDPPEIANAPVTTVDSLSSPTPGAEVSAPAAAIPNLSEEAISRAVPVPETAQVPPPTLKDIGGVPLDTADAVIADKLKEAIASKLDRITDRKKERAAIEEFYKSRSYAPLWLEAGLAGPRMKAAVARLRAADADGLEPGDYAVADPASLGKEPEALAQAELKLTNAVLNFARHAQSGRVIPSRISNNIEFNPPVPEPAAVLQTVAGAPDIAKALSSFNPPHEGFQALRRKLVELRKLGDDHQAHVPTGPTVKVGMSDKRVPLVRERLGVAGEDMTYDRELADAVKRFQRQKGLKDTGLLSASTVEALNGRSRSRDVNAIISNMERWRWLPRDLGSAYVQVNVPDFSLKVVRGQSTLFRTRIVVGKPNTPSPSFSAQIENILVNPTWHVPESIIYNEYLPALQQDPGVLSRMGLIMERNRDGSISIRQPPSERNALGRIKFNFPNRFQVYLHDTPDKKLFALDKRAFSHGCMRVQNPTQFGEVLASIAVPEQSYTAERLQRMFGSGEQWINFKRKIPVHITYLNAYVDDDGKLVVREDLYGYDGRVQAALRGEYMAITERSQRVVPGAAAARRTATNRPEQRRWAVQEQGQRGFFFPWFQ